MADEDKGRKPLDDMVKAFLQSELMEETASYLKRGRGFAGLAPDELERKWTASFNAWVAHRREAERILTEDLEAELRIRGLEPPLHAVPEAIAAAKKDFRTGSEAYPRVLEKVRAFLAAREKGN